MAAQLTLEGARGVFPAAVQVVDDVGDFPAAAVDGHGDIIDDEVGLAVVRHRPAQEYAGEHVGDAGW